MPAEFAGLQPPPPTLRSVALLQRLPLLWVPAEPTVVGAASIDAADPAGFKQDLSEAQPATGESTLSTPVQQQTGDAPGKVRRLEGPRPGPAGEVFAPAGSMLDVLMLQLQLLLLFLREEHLYCLYCGCAYDDSQQLAGNCPGLSEEDH